MIEIDKEIKDKINALASIAVAALREEGAVLSVLVHISMILTQVIILKN